jgi:hypothetical protein
MDFLLNELGRDAFGLVLEYCDPAKEPQRERQAKLNYLFYSVKAGMSGMSGDAFIDRSDWIRTLRYYDTGRSRNIFEWIAEAKSRNKGISIDYLIDLYKRELWGGCVNYPS